MTLISLHVLRKLDVTSLLETLENYKEDERKLEF